MEFIEIILGSYLFTKIIDKTIVSKLSKQYMDIGYNLNTLDEKEIFEDIIIVPKLATIIPLYNVIMRLFILKYINNYNKEIFDELVERKTLTKMELTDLVRYRKNPSVFNSLAINRSIIRNKEKQNEMQKIILTINNEPAEIEYKMNNLTGNLDITMLKGPLDIIISDKEAKQIVKNSWFILLRGMEKIYNNELVLVRELQKNNYYSMDIEKNDMNIEKIEFYYNPKQLTKVLHCYNKNKNSRD